MPEPTGGAGRRAAAAAAAAPAASPRPLRCPVEADGPRGGGAGPGERPSLAHQTWIVEVEGIGPAAAEKLAAVGIATTDELLAAGANPCR